MTGMNTFRWWGLPHLAFLLLTLEVVQALTWQQSPPSNRCSDFVWQRRGIPVAPTVSSSSECLFATTNFGRTSNFGRRRWLISRFASTQKDDNGEATEGSTQKPTSPSKKTIPVSHLANDANLSTLTKNNPTWDQNIAALLEYNATHGTVNLPSPSKEYPNLGLWVSNLRQQKGRLTKEQIQQLEDIGFIWKNAKMSKLDQKWYEMFMKLKAFKEKYGHCRVKYNYEDKQLRGWVKKQRQVYWAKKIRKDRKDLLESIGFAWRLLEFFERDRPDYEELWEKRYQELIEFKEQHNHTNVPKEYAPNKELAIWVNEQRTRNKDGTLREDRIPRLDKIGFIWEFEPIWDESWLEQYEELKKYYQELASYKEMIKNTPEVSEAAIRPVLGKKIHDWAANQRLYNARGDLDLQKKAMLDDIGFDWRE